MPFPYQFGTSGGEFGVAQTQLGKYKNEFQL